MSVDEMKRAETESAAMPAAIEAESQQQRWLKYGSNVALSIVLVIACAGVLIFLAQRYSKRIDVTSGSAYSLKDQTKKIIEDLPSEVTLVCLYPKLKPDEVGQQQDTYQPVVDILEEYRRKSNKIKVLVIDPITEPSKLDQWIRDLIETYGENVPKYKEFLGDKFPKVLEEITQGCKAEMAFIKPLHQEDIKRNSPAEQVLFLCENTVDQFPVVLEKIDQQTKEELKKVWPDYTAQAEHTQAVLTVFSRQCAGLAQYLKELQDEASTPEKVKSYAKDSIPRFIAMKEKADALLATAKGLGELKLAEVRKKLFRGEEGKEPEHAIAVMGKSDVRMIEFKDVWKPVEQDIANDSGGTPKLRFAGEQQLTTAILSMTTPKKQMVAIVRGGGPPMLGAMGEDGAFTTIAERLKSFNFDVKETDISGTWQRMAMQRGMMPMPEPSEADIKDAIWIVVVDPPNTNNMSPVQLGPKVAAHLQAGKSALLMFAPGADRMDMALRDWGIDVRTDVVCVHDIEIGKSDARTGDLIEDARRGWAPLFIMSDYGNSPVTEKMQSLDFVTFAMVPVSTRDAAGVKNYPVLPLPQDPRSWADKQFNDLFGRKRVRPTFKPDDGDVGGQLYGGSIASKENGARLVVLGTSRFAYGDLVNFEDQNLANKGISVVRFPGNGELVTNSVFWLAHQDNMIGLSPAALDVSRISAMSAGTLNFWRIGVLLILVPLSVIGAGVWVYYKRLD